MSPSNFIPESTAAVRELDHRRTNDLEVWLLWNSDDDSVSVEVSDDTTGRYFRIAISDRAPLEVFHHPFASPDIEDFQGSWQRHEDRRTTWLRPRRFHLHVGR